MERKRCKMDAGMQEEEGEPEAAPVIVTEDTTSIISAEPVDLSDQMKT